MSTTFKGSYWDNDGKYQDKYEYAWKTYIPASGEAEDGWPEALRAISRIGYDYYNNGFCNLWQTWDEGPTEMSDFYKDFVDYLSYHVPHNLYKEFKGWLQTTKGYCNWGSGGDDVIDRIIDHIIENMEHEDMFEELNIESV